VKVTNIGSVSYQDLYASSTIEKRLVENGSPPARHRQKDHYTSLMHVNGMRKGLPRHGYSHLVSAMSVKAPPRISLIAMMTVARDNSNIFVFCDNSMFQQILV